MSSEASAATASQVLYKNVNVTPIRLDGGEGVWLVDSNGHRYLDTCGGVAVSSLGHCHPRIVDAMRRESSKLCWAHAGSFTTGPAEELASLLASSSGSLSKAQFLCGGSESMELSLKIAYQYQCEIGQPERTLFIAREQSYHGSTLGTLAISGNRQRRGVFERALMEAAFVSPCYSYRDRHAGESEDAYAQRLARELDVKLQQIGAGKVAAFIVEPVVGSTNGAVPAVPGYLRAVKRVCDEHGVLLLLDEVMCGMGRTGHLFAYLEDEVRPDIVAFGKGLAAGYQPISGLLVSDRVHAALAAGSGVLQNGQTHVNHPFGCAIALEVQRTIIEERLLDNVIARGRQLQSLLRERLSQFDCLGDVRGRGLFVGVELVRDRATKACLRDGPAFAARLKAEALRRHLLIYPGWGTVDGTNGNHVLFAPPFISTASEIEEMVGRFAETLQACI